MENPRMDNQG